MTALEAITADALASPAIGHGFFTRHGGASQGIYAGLNCGRGSRDDRAPVEENRIRAARHMGVAPADLLSLHQHHSADVVFADAPWRAGAQPRADAIVTDRPGVAISAMAADCAPVLLADAEAGVIGAAHAGWKGALGGVLEAVVAAMITRGAQRERIAAAIGPCISQRAYEVGPEFVETFLGESRDHSRFFAGGEGDRAMFDLPGFCLYRLRSAGVERGEWVGHCTYSDPDRFYSYRRATHDGEPDYGRMISAIVMRG